MVNFILYTIVCNRSESKKSITLRRHKKAVERRNVIVRGRDTMRALFPLFIRLPYRIRYDTDRVTNQHALAYTHLVLRYIKVKRSFVTYDDDDVLIPRWYTPSECQIIQY